MPGFSALHIAARSKHYSVIKVLVSAGAALELRTGTGKTAVELAMKNGCDSSVVALLQGEKVLISPLRKALKGLIRPLRSL